MKRLLVDIGNTRIKWALASDNEIEQQNQFVWHEAELVERFEQQWGGLSKPEQVLISSVADVALGEAITAWISQNWNLNTHFAKVSQSCGGVTNSYPIPESLGIDRWLAMLAAWDLHKRKVCVIDCGSAVTIDVLDMQGQHLGGMIAPGLSLLGQVLTEKTYALNADHGKEFPMLANNTEDAINSGCYHQFVGGIQYSIDKIQQQFGTDMKYIITGGDAEILLTELKIEMDHEANLILQGLILSSK